MGRLLQDLGRPGMKVLLAAEVTRDAVAALEPREGMLVYAGFKATGVRTYS